MFVFKEQMLTFWLFLWYTAVGMFHLQCVHITSNATYNSRRPGALLSSKYLFSLLPVDPPQATSPHNTQLLLDRNLLCLSLCLCLSFSVSLSLSLSLSLCCVWIISNHVFSLSLSAVCGLYLTTFCLQQTFVLIKDVVFADQDVFQHV